MLSNVSATAGPRSGGLGMTGPELGGAGSGLIFLLGLRHGLDPDHIAVIDNFTFRAVEERSATAPWTGALFAAGHSLSVGAVALLVAGVAARFVWPGWLSEAVDWAVIGLLVLVGVLNLRALRRPGVYTPAGWRQSFVFRKLRGGSHPLAILATGVLFGLVFDTATQAAAWGAAASARTGLLGAAIVAALFAAGMILTDTADSRIVAGLLRSGGDASRVKRYRRSVGWIIVGLSFGMAAYALATKLGWMRELSDLRFTLMGVTMVAIVIGALLIERHLRRPRAAEEPA